MINTTINTKLIAMLSNHIQMDSFEEFATILDVSEFALALQETKRYHQILASVDASALHRLELEKIIQSIKKIDYQKIKRFMPEGFYLLELEQEIDELIILLHIRQSESNYQFETSWIEKCIHLETQDFINVLKEHHYEFLIPYLDDLLQGELYLKKHLFLKTKARYETESPKLVAAYHDELILFLLSYVYRFKKYYETSKQNLTEIFKPLFDVLNIKPYEHYITSQTSNEIYPLLGYDSSLEIPLERFVYGTLYKTYLRNMRFEDDTLLKFFSYMRLVDIEIKNITDLIEGIRYKIGQDKMIELLIKEAMNNGH